MSADAPNDVVAGQGSVYWRTLTRIYTTTTSLRNSSEHVSCDEMASPPGCVTRPLLPAIDQASGLYPQCSLFDSILTIHSEQASHTLQTIRSTHRIPLSTHPRSDPGRPWYYKARRTYNASEAESSAKHQAGGKHFDTKSRRVEAEFPALDKKPSEQIGSAHVRLRRCRRRRGGGSCVISSACRPIHRQV